MEEPKMENFEGGVKPATVGEAMPMQTQAPAPMPASPVEQQQSASNVPPVVTEVERMQMEMQPIDLSAQPSTPVQQGGIAMQMEAPAGGGNKKIMIIVGAIVAVVVVGAVAFFVWKSMQQPAEEAPVVEQAPTTPLVLTPMSTTTEPGGMPTAQPDDISVIEQDLNAFNVGGIDAEVEANLSEVSKSL